MRHPVLRRGGGGWLAQLPRVTDARRKGLQVSEMHSMSSPAVPDGVGCLDHSEADTPVVFNLLAVRQPIREPAQRGVQIADKWVWRCEPAAFVSLRRVALGLLSPPVYDDTTATVWAVLRPTIINYERTHPILPLSRPPPSPQSRVAAPSRMRLLCARRGNKAELAGEQHAYLA